jgi:hypothetical protein
MPSEDGGWSDGRACVKLFVKLCVKLWMTFEAQLDAGAARRILS